MTSKFLGVFMIIISSRKNFVDCNEVSLTHDIKNIDLVNPNPAVPSIGINDFLAQIAGRRVLLLIHGYNNDFLDIVRSYRSIEAAATLNIKNQYDFVVGYTWAGGDDISDYPAAKRRAGSISSLFSPLLQSISATTGGQLDVMAHSMGSRLAFLAIQNSNAVVQIVRNLFTTAAAVDNESLESGQEYHHATKLCQKVYVFHSIHDFVLNGGYRAVDFDTALGLSGPEDPANIIKYGQNIKVVNCKHVVKKHGNYKTCDQIYQYIQNELSGVPSPQFTTL